MKKYKIINGILGCLMNALAIAAIQTIGFPSLNAFERQLSTSMAIDQMSGSAQYIDYAPMIRCDAVEIRIRVKITQSQIAEEWRRE